MNTRKQGIELADIFRSHAENYLKTHELVPEQVKAFDAITKCRTLSLGGHIDRCNKCGFEKPSYNSCRNRHCPKCQFIKKVQWVDKLAANLPPVKHFHLVFTIPACLHKLFYLNQEVAYVLLFQSTSKALQQCAANPDFLGVRAGAVAILHTWGQTLVYHPHIHMIVPAGGLSEDQMEWIHAPKKFFLPVKALSQVFRGVLCKLLEHEIGTGKIKLPDDCSGFAELKEQCYKKKWVVFSEKPFSCANSLIEYLGNYTHRVAISNERIKSHEDQKVSFSYKDYKSAGLKRIITLDADEFIRRFLQHVLPQEFYKIRYFGFMAMCNAKSQLALCYDLIRKATFLPVLQGLSAFEVLREITGKDPTCCPNCKSGRLMIRAIIPEARIKPG